MHDHFFILDHYHYYHYFLSIIIINLIIMRKDNSIFCPFESGFIANLIIKHCFFLFPENSRWLWNISWDFLILDHFDHRDAGSKNEKDRLQNH